MTQTIEDILAIIRDEAYEADRKALAACVRSKYSIQDYYMCLEFYLQRLHDRIAKESGLEIRCPHYPMRKQIGEFRKELQNQINGQHDHGENNGTSEMD